MSAPRAAPFRAQGGQTTGVLRLTSLGRPSLSEEQCEAVVRGDLKVRDSRGSAALRRPFREEVDEYRKAQACGWFWTKGPGRVPIERLYRCYCEATDRPFVAIRTHGAKRVNVTLDMYTCVRNLTTDGLKAIRAVHDEHVDHRRPPRGATFGGGFGSDHCSFNNLDPAHADAVAAAFWRIANDPAFLESCSEWHSEMYLKPQEERALETTIAQPTNGAQPPVQRARVVRFYKDYSAGGNGQFGTVTTAASPEEFLRECSPALIAALGQTEGDWDFTLEHLLPQICDVWARLRGYKSENVFEQRLLIAGSPNPDAHMRPLDGG